MKERPILFSGPMVLAILEGRKTQTRRVAKVHETSPGMISPDPYHVPRSPQEHVSYCPHGVPGDRLWVRETFRWVEGTRQLAYAADKPAHILREMKTLHQRWKPAIFMPRWACRITLAITDVRVQRLQEITYEDAQAEGCNPPEVRMFSLFGADAEQRRKIYSIHAELGFKPLWDSINAKRGFGWDKNPWVWAITFRRVEA